MILRILLAAVSCVVWRASIAQDWVPIKSAKELTALYSDKTFKGNGWVGHYRADGQGILIAQNGKPVRRTWKVVGEDQICTTLENGSTSCSRFQRHRTKRNAIVITRMTDGMTFNVTVQDGIPNF
jgi:hypothetical protein